ncbi:MAG: hypothetical protein IKT56_06905 [Clostridia bacterium]|nr:hypothetical protein [Clostridia bacterium]
MKKILFLILTLSLITILISCGISENEYKPESTADESKKNEEMKPSDFAPESTRGEDLGGGLTVEDKSLDNLPLHAILDQMLDSVRIKWGNDFGAYEFDKSKIAEIAGDYNFDVSAVDEALAYANAKDPEEFIVLLLRMKDGEDSRVFSDELKKTLKNQHNDDIIETDYIVSAYRGKIVLFIVSDDDDANKENIATLIGSFSSVDAKKYDLRDYE